MMITLHKALELLDQERHRADEAVRTLAKCLHEHSKRHLEQLKSERAMRDDELAQCKRFAMYWLDRAYAADKRNEQLIIERWPEVPSPPAPAATPAPATPPA